MAIVVCETFWNGKVGNKYRIQGTGTAKSRTQTPTNEIADCWSATHRYIFNIRLKSMQQIKSILIGWGETNDLANSFIKFLG